MYYSAPQTATVLTGRNTLSIRGQALTSHQSRIDARYARKQLNVLA